MSTAAWERTATSLKRDHMVYSSRARIRLQSSAKNAALRIMSPSTRRRRAPRENRTLVCCIMRHLLRPWSARDMCDAV